MKATKAAYKLIEDFEECRLSPYLDPNGIPTIGCGHTRTVSINQHPITKGQAIILLRQDVEIVEAIINNQFPPLRQEQFDAVVSLIFNVKWGTIKKSRLFQEIKKNPDCRRVAYEWIEFSLAGGKYYRGLLRRRIAELDLYYSWK